METIQTQAIVLSSIPYKERDKILSLFSPSLGLFSLYMGNTRKSVLENGALASPLSVGYFHIRPSRSDLYRFIEGKVLNPHLPLREDYTLLSTALDCLNSLKNSQWKAEPAPSLYELFLKILQWLQNTPSPEKVLPFFQLKILKHEGLFSGHAVCSSCGKQQKGSFQGAEFFCEAHLSEPANLWNSSELLAVEELFHARSFQQVERLPFPASLNEKILLLFTSLIENGP